MANRICIIEDDEGIQDMLKMVLQNAGFDTTVSSDGRSVLENKNDLPDLYLLDKQLPGLDGLNICEFLKLNQATKTVPVIMMSAHPNVKELALNAGADDFLEKPFSIKTLLKMIEGYLSEHSFGKALH
ncbi:MAG TPA: response regulator transcription factor [Chitinophagaceae bacterium]